MLFQNDLFLGAGLFTFRCNPVTGTCRNGTLGDTTGTPGPQPTPPGSTATPEVDECPLNLRVSQQPPTLGANKIAPAYPIVVGQDPMKRGVDVSADIQIHPVIVKYDVPKYEHECQYVGSTGTDSACQNQIGWKKVKINPWDIAAGCLLVTEAGGRVSAPDGSPLDLFARQAVASNGLLQNEMLEVLAQSKPWPII